MIIVKIRSVCNAQKKQQGTGFFLELKNKDFNMIITAAHCIEEIDKSEIVIDYEINKTKFSINSDDIFKKYIIEDSDDIGIILIKKTSVEIEFTNPYIFYLDKANSKEIDNIYLSGYPNKANENISDLKCVDLKGRVQYEDIKNKSKIFNFKYNPSGSLQSIDEKQRMEGFSGGVIYRYINERNVSIIGMAQRVQCEDDNPYSQIEAINILSIFESLKKNNFIIYDVFENVFSVKWIREENYFKEYTDENILVIGSSGAGKSSFIKGFAYNKELINSSGDGQTTRSDINYKFSLLEENPRVTTKFLKQAEFQEQRMESIEFGLLEYQIKKMGFPDLDFKSQNDILLKYCMGSLDNYFSVKENEDEIYKEFNAIRSEFYNIDFMDSIESNIIILELTEQLILVLELLEKKLGYILFKLLLNKNYRKKMIVEEANKLKEILGNKNTNELEKEVYKKIISNTEEDIELIKSLDLKEYYDIFSKKESDNLEECFKQLVLVQKGLFSYKEFDYFGKNKNELISKLIKIEFYNMFNDAKSTEYTQLKKNIKKFYGEIFTLLKNSIKGDYENEFYLNDINEEQKLKIEMILKVNDKGSVSSLVSKVFIYDKISNEYATILDKLKIKTISFIDTQGLDHIENGKLPEKRLYELFNGYNYDINNVFYIKKMDSGKPTELENIIPKLYDVKPNIALYCIFTGIDIFYNEHNKGGIVDWNVSTDKIPKAPLYIKTKEGEDKIKYSMNRKLIKKGRVKTVYATLEKNLIPFYADSSSSKNELYRYNNKYHIEKLFKSLKVREHLGLELIDTEKIIKKMNQSVFKEILDKVLYSFFERASIVDWFNSNWGHGHRNTKRANVEKIKALELGYSRSYNDLWNFKFNQAYSEIFSYEQETESLTSVETLFNLKEDEIWQEKLEALLIDFRDVFLGCEKYKNSIFYTSNSLCKDCDHIKCFRKILLSNYDLDDNTNKMVYKYRLNENSVSEEIYLNEICNFAKAYKNSKDDFIALFIEKFSEKISNENNKNINIILSINPEIDEIFSELKDKVKQGFVGSTNPNIFPEILEILLKK